MNCTLQIIWCVKEYQKPIIKVCKCPQRDISASSGYLLFWEWCCFAISLLRNMSTNFQFIVWMEEFVFQAVLKHLFHSAGECSLNRQLLSKGSFYLQFSLTSFWEDFRIDFFRTQMSVIKWVAVKKDWFATASALLKQSYSVFMLMFHVSKHDLPCVSDGIGCY